MHCNCIPRKHTFFLPKEIYLRLVNEIKRLVTAFQPTDTRLIEFILKDKLFSSNSERTYSDKVTDNLGKETFYKKVAK